MAKLVIRHDLHLLNEQEARQYLRDVSEFLEIDPDLNAFDLIWMPNPSGEGKTLCVYARRGTCELLRNKHEIEVNDQTETLTEGSYVVRVKGQDRTGRKEIALGSRSLEGLKGRDRDDAIMTASTRALQRLTMQFTGLGILSESEVVALANQAVVAPNPAAGASLAGSPMVIPPQPSVVVNNAPGKPVETPVEAPKAQTSPVSTWGASEALTVLPAKADIKADISAISVSTTPVESITYAGQESGQKPARKPRKSKNTVSLGVDPEPERVTSIAAATPPKEPVCCLDCKKPLSEHLLVNSVKTCPDKMPSSSNVEAVLKSQNSGGWSGPVPTSVSAHAASVSASADIPISQPSTTSPPVATVSPQTQPIGDLPTAEQMATYRTVVATYTKELPPSKDGTYGCTQRMRAFITKWNNGIIPQQMNVKQWDEMIAWFQQFVEKNGIKGLITYIGDFLGDNK